MEYFFDETIFWLFFIFSNSILYLINYIFYFKDSSFLPYIQQFKVSRKPGIAASLNQDVFRYSVEFSVFLLLIRIVDLRFLSGIFSIYYSVIFVFNLYQYSIRKIYETQPNFYNDLKLIKNGLAIIWHESKWKITIGIVVTSIALYCFYSVIKTGILFSNSLLPNPIFYTFSVLWLFTVIWSLIKLGIYLDYPDDIYLRNHFSLYEIYINLKLSLLNRKIFSKKIGKKFFKSREKIRIELIDGSPNIHFIFIESYGSYFYREHSLRKKSKSILDAFFRKISEHKWMAKSNFSKSPTVGGQSWLSYSSMLYGLKIENNTYFENYLHDIEFARSNNILRVLKNCGYTNYNLNPISPIKGINVPYKQIREFYAIDRWILNDSLSYNGDVYGFGECAPDQYSMNFTMDLINQEKPDLYTFFYLTKNSHSPFLTPPIVDDWKGLNNTSGKTHIHKGFLSNPKKDAYAKAIDYQLNVLSRFILDHGKRNDIFLLIGDHQPPMLSDPKKFGCETPVHIISKDNLFLDNFNEYGFCSDLFKCDDFVKHEGLFSIFLGSFTKRYGKASSVIPEYEPDGLQL